MIKLWIARRARERLQNGSADPSYFPRAMRTRKLRAKKNMPVPLNPQQKTTPLSTNMIKAVSTTVKTTAKTPCYLMQKTQRKNYNNEDDDRTGAEDNNFYVNGDSDNDGNGGVDRNNGYDGGDRNTGAIGGSAEWLRFLIPSALT